MRRAPYILLCALLAPALWAQATISGTVSEARGPLAGATVRARNVASGLAYQTESSETGAYSLAVPPATYDLFISSLSYRGFIQRDVTLKAGQKMPLDVTLAYGPNFGIVGENGFGFLRQEHAPPDGKAPRMADGTPDFRGVWFPGQDVDPEVPPYRPWAAALQKSRAAEFGKDDPRAHCLPSGVPRTSQFDLTKIIQTPEEIVILIEGTDPGFRQIFLDGRGHPSDLQPSWMGHSIGRWEGSTLVIDTVGFNDRGWVDGAGDPQTEQLHTIERYTRPDLGHLNIEITVDDPGAYERPWKIRRELTLADGFELEEYVCHENEKPEHLVGK